MTNSDNVSPPATNYLAWLLGSFTFVALLAIFFPIAYGANDDSGVLLSLARIADPQIDPLLTTQAPIFAVALGGLYGQAPSIPWYGIALGTGTALGLGLLGQSIPWKALPIGVRSLVAAGLGILAFDAAYFWTFTKAMLVLQFAGFAQIFRWQFESDRRSFPYLAVIVPLILGYCFRWYFFHMTVAFAFPIVLAFRMRHLASLVVVALLFGAFRGGDYLVHQQLYSQDVAYQEYGKFHEKRYRFHDMPEGYENTHTPTALKNAGWTKDDYLFFRTLWGIYDEIMVSPETLTAFLSENIKGTAIDKSLTAPDSSPWLQVMASSWKSNGAALLAAAIPLLVLIASVIRGGGMGILQRLVLVAGLVSLFVYLFANRLPLRVGEPVMIYMGVILAITLGHRIRSGTLRPFIEFLLVAQVAAAGPYWHAFGEFFKGNKAANQEFTEFLNKLDPAIRNRAMIVLDPRKGFLPETNHPIWEEKLFDRGLDVVPCGTKVNSPLYRRYLKKHGYAGGREMLVDAMKGQRIAFFSFADEPETLRLWTSYLNRNLAKDAGHKVKFRTLASSKDGSMSILELVEDK